MARSLTHSPNFDILWKIFFHVVTISLMGPTGRAAFSLHAVVVLAIHLQTCAIFSQPPAMTYWTIIVTMATQILPSCFDITDTDQSGEVFRLLQYFSYYNHYWCQYLMLALVLVQVLMVDVVFVFHRDQYPQYWDPLFHGVHNH